MNDFLNRAWELLSSPDALVIYVIVVLVLVVLLGILAISNEYKRPNFTINNTGETITTVKTSLSINSDKSILLGTGIQAIGAVATGVPGNGQGAPVQEETEPEEEEIEEDSETRFYMLTQIDEKYANAEPLNYENDIDLENFCTDFREFACNKLRLFYDIRDIRRFVTSLAVSHTMILQGMSGTGKTSLAYAFGEFIKNASTVVPIQPMWKERTDMLGYYNEFTRKFNETTLLNKIYEANYNDKIYITVLDEMNIARVEYYFAEFLSLLELPNPDARYLDVVTDKWETDPKLLRNGQVKLPNNMWFIGTANNDDSTFAISDKVYDRAMIINLDTKSNAFDGKETKPRMLSATRFFELTTEAKNKYKITRRNLDRIKKLDSYMIKTFHITFGNRIMKQIKEYVPVFIGCGGDELEAIDDLLSRKVMRKLESQNPVYVRKVSQELMNCLDDIFGFDKMKLCKEYIELLSRVS